MQLTGSSFSSFFNHIDHFPQEEFLYVTSGGIGAARPALAPGTTPQATEAGAGKTDRKSQREALAEVEEESEDETLPNNGEEGG